MMKNTRIILFAASLCIIPFVTSGQEKKNEKEIKVIVTDKAGTEVVIDTTFTKEIDVDTLVMKDGKVIIVSEGGNGHKCCSGKHSKVVTKVVKEGDEEGKKYIYINDMSFAGNDEKIFEVEVGENEFEQSPDRMKYVISKDGIRVIIEGSDEAKVKEIIDEVEKSLGIGKDIPATETEAKKSDKKSGK